MPRGKVKTSYQRVKRSPRRREPVEAAESTPEYRLRAEGDTLSPLTRYITENEASGLPIQELIRQFQEYDCTHPRFRVVSVMAVGDVDEHYHHTTCEICGLSKRKKGRG